MLKGNGQLRTLDAMTSLRSIGSTVTLINNGNHNVRLLCAHFSYLCCCERAM